MSDRRRARRKATEASRWIPCGGKGWRAGMCDFCQRKGADYCPLRNVPRDTPEVVTIVDVLRTMQRRGRR